MNYINPTIDDHESRAALMLAALGNEYRLRIFRILVRAGDNGLNVGDLQQKIDIPASTLSHHIATLRQASLIDQRREGREIYNSANYNNMDALVGFLTDNCCVDTTEAETGEEKP